MDQPEILRQVIEAKVARSFEPSRMEGELLAVAYETAVPIRRAARSLQTLEQVQNMAVARFTRREAAVQEIQG